MFVTTAIDYQKPKSARTTRAPQITIASASVKPTNSLMLISFPICVRFLDTYRLRGCLLVFFGNLDSDHCGLPCPILAKVDLATYGLIVNCAEALCPLCHLVEFHRDKQQYLSIFLYCLALSHCVLLSCRFTCYEGLL